VANELWIARENLKAQGSRTDLTSEQIHRHLNKSQRAMVGAKLANMPAHRPAEYKSENFPTSAVSQPQAAKLLNVSNRTIRDAKTIVGADIAKK